MKERTNRHWTVSAKVWRKYCWMNVHIDCRIKKGRLKKSHTQINKTYILVPEMHVQVRHPLEFKTYPFTQRWKHSIGGQKFIRNAEDSERSKISIDNIYIKSNLYMHLSFLIEYICIFSEILYEECMNEKYQIIQVRICILVLGFITIPVYYNSTPFCDSLSICP